MPPAHAIPSHIRLRAWERDQRLAALGYSSYTEYINSPAWRSVRRRYAERHPWLCNLCGATETLQLHHRTYDRVGEERLDDLMPLCEDCHEMVHALEWRGKVGLDFEGVINTARAMRNRATTAARRTALEDERRADREAFKESLESLPLDERIRRAMKAADRTRSGKVRHQRRIIEIKFKHGEATREFVLRRIRAMEHIAYRFDIEP